MHALRALIYARVSKPVQKRRAGSEQDEPSLGEQAEAMRREAQRRGWQVVTTLEDVLTGSVPVKDRPGGSLIYQYAAEDRFDILMVYDNDRIGRDEDGVVAKVFRADLRFLSKQVFSCHQPLEPKAPADYRPYEDDSALWLESVSDTASSIYIRQFRRRHAFGMRNRVEVKKLMAGSPPAGYVAERHILPGGRTFLGERTVDPVYGAVVQRIFNAYEAGHSALAIARILNREGLRTPAGKLWSDGSIKNIIDNPTYYGAAVYNKRGAIGRPDPRHPRRRLRLRRPIEEWVIVEGAGHPALITKEQWLHCQAIKRSRGKYGRTFGESTLLSGLVRCGKCEATMYRSGSWNGGYFACSRYRHTGGAECSPNSIRVNDLQARVLAYLGELARSPELLDRLQVVQSEARATRTESEVEAVRQQIAALDRRLEKAREAYEVGADTLPEYVRRKAELAAQRAELQSRSEQIAGELRLLAQGHEVKLCLAQILAGFPEQFLAKPLRLQKALLREIVEKVVVDEEQIEVVFRQDTLLASEYERAIVMLRLYSEE